MESSLSSTGPSYDPNVIIQAAEEKLTKENDFEGGQMIFQAALLEWVDDAREGSSSKHNNRLDSESIREAIATLWLAYAHFLALAKQFKSATEAYEEAVQCPVAGSVGRVWLDYARFAEERRKLKTAQDIYLRALVGSSSKMAAVTDEQDQNLLWHEFLDMMRKSNPELTLRDLQSAVQVEHVATVATDPETAPELVTSLGDSSSPPVAPPPSKRLKIEDGVRMNIEDGVSMYDMPNKTHVVTAQSVDVEATAFAEGLLQQSVPPDLAAAWMARDGNGSAQPPEPPLFLPSPPKLSDPTAKDILGVDLAIRLVERVMSASGTLLLEVCRGLWALHALKQKKATEAIEMLDTSMKLQMETLETSLEARAAAGTSAAVEQANQRARQEFQSQCGIQRQNLLTGIAWEFRQLLYVQQQVLAKLQVPGFEGGPTVDGGALDFQARVCSYLHSAFFLRSRVEEELHVNMLKSHLKSLLKEQKEKRESSSPVPPSFVQLQQQLPPPPPPLIVGYLPPPPPNMMMMPQHDYGTYQQQGQQQHMLPPLPPIMGTQQHMPPPPPPPGGHYGSQQQQQYPPYYQ